MDNTSTIRRNGRTRLVEVVWALDDCETIHYRVPYASTFTKGGQYEGSYRGYGTGWYSEVI